MATEVNKTTNHEGLCKGMLDVRREIEQVKGQLSEDVGHGEKRRLIHRLKELQYLHLWYLGHLVRGSDGS